MWVRTGITLCLSVILTSCGGGSSSGGTSSASQIAPQNQATDSGSFENVSLTVDFPLDRALSTKGSISFTGRVEALTSYSNAEVRVTNGSDSFSSSLGSGNWIVEDVSLLASATANYQVDLLVDGQVIDTKNLQLGFDEYFYPFGIGEALVLDGAGDKAYLLDDRQIFEIDVSTGQRSEVVVLSSAENTSPNDLAWLSAQGVLMLLDADGEAQLYEQTGSDWHWSGQVEGFSANQFVSSQDGQNLYAYESASNAVKHYSADFSLIEQFALTGYLSDVEEMAVLNSEALLLFGDDSLVVLNPNTSSFVSFSIGSLNIGSIGDLAVDTARNQVYVRSASTNQLLRLELELGGSPEYTSEIIDLGGAVSYAMTFSDAEDELLFSSGNQLNALDAESNVLSVISDLGWGAGADWVAPASLAMETEGSYAYVSDLATDDIYQVDLQTGFRTSLNTNGESMEAVTGMVQDGQNLYSVDWVKKSVLMTDVDSGLTSDLIPDNASQPDLSEPIAIDLDEGRFRAFVLDRGLRSIYEIDTSSGSTSVIADSLAVNALTLAKDLSFAEANQAIYWSSWLDNSLHRLDLNSLQAGLVSGQARGAGVSFGRPNSIALNSDGSTAYVSDALDTRIFSVDLDTGERQVISDSNILSKPESIAFDQTRGVLNVLDSGTGALYALDPLSGDLVLISM